DWARSGIVAPVGVVVGIIGQGRKEAVEVADRLRFHVRQQCLEVASKHRVGLGFEAFLDLAERHARIDEGHLASSVTWYGPGPAHHTAAASPPTRARRTSGG